MFVGVAPGKVLFSHAANNVFGTLCRDTDSSVWTGEFEEAFGKVTRNAFAVALWTNESNIDVTVNYYVAVSEMDFAVDHGSEQGYRTPVHISTRYFVKAMVVDVVLHVVRL